MIEDESGDIINRPSTWSNQTQNRGSNTNAQAAVVTNVVTSSQAVNMASTPQGKAGEDDFTELMKLILHYSEVLKKSKQILTSF